MSECEWCNRGLPINAVGEHYRPQELDRGKTLLCAVVARKQLAEKDKEIERMRLVLRSVPDVVRDNSMSARINLIKDWREYEQSTKPEGVTET